MLLVLQRSAAHQAAVQKLIDGQHDPASATYHQSSLWIDPVCYTDSNTRERACYTAYYPTPADTATQYSPKPFYASGVLGKGVTLGIISDSNVDMSNVLHTMHGTQCDDQIAAT